MVQNLIPYPYYYAPPSFAGITVTDNGKGELTFNGTATGFFSAELVYYNLLPNFSVGDTLILKGCPKGGSEDTFFLVLNCSGKDDIIDTGDGAIFTVQEGFTVNLIEVFIVIKEGTTMDNVVFKPYLGKLSIADKLTTIAENEQRVYAAGQKSEYDRFWDLFQNYGKRTYYYNAFAWQNKAVFGWATEAYNPKYPIVCEGANAGASIFHYSTAIKDVKVPITIRNTSAKNAFYRCYALENIPSLTLEGVPDFDFTFASCEALAHITIHGSIDVNISFAESPLLTNESVQSIIDHLADLTGKAAQTLTLHATVGNKLTDAQKAACTAKNWQLVY